MAAENDVQIIVNCPDPDLRAAWLGLVAHLIRSKQIPADLTVLEHQQASVDIAVSNPDEVANMLATLSANKQLTVSVVEQIECPENLVADLLNGGIKTGVVDLSGPGKSIQDLGLDYGEIAEILESTHRRIREANNDELNDDVAQQISDETSEALREYIQEKAHNSNLHISAHHEKVGEGAYEFALAIAVDGAGGGPIDAGQLAKELKRRRKD